MNSQDELPAVSNRIPYEKSFHPAREKLESYYLMTTLALICQDFVHFFELQNFWVSAKRATNERERREREREETWKKI